jgi:hypothetical protein
VHRPGKAKATVQHFCTTFQLSTVATQGSPPRNSSRVMRSASLGACAILVQFLQDTSVHERSLTNATLIAYRCFPPFFRRVLDHGESVPWFTATPCIFRRWSRVFLPEYQRSSRKLDYLGSCLPGILRTASSMLPSPPPVRGTCRIYHLKKVCAGVPALHPCAILPLCAHGCVLELCDTNGIGLAFWIVKSKCPW